MKNLGYLYHRAKTAILAPHYQPFLETLDRENILLAQKKKSVNDLLSILRQIALKAIQKLSQSHCFLGEIKWQTAFAKYESQLKNPNSQCLSTVHCTVSG